MKKIYAIIFALVLLPTVAFGYTVQKGDYPIKLWGDNWRIELSKYGIDDPTKLPVGLEVDLDEPTLGATPTPTSSAPRVYIESPDWQLYNGAAAGDTTITLDDLEDIYGTDITMGSSTKMYGRINPDGVSESISFTGITTNSDGTKTLTGVKTVLAQYPYTETSGLALSHSIGSLFRLSNTAGFYNDFANKENAEIIENIWTYNQFPIVSSSTALPDANGEFATKYYVDTVGAGGFTSVNIATNEGLKVFGTSPETAGVYVRADKGMVTSTTGVYQSVDSSTGVLGEGASGITFSTSTLIDLIATSTPTAGKIPISTSTQYISSDWIAPTSQSFGGSGDDGVLSMVSTTTNLDASSETILIKNYSSISIDASSTLGLSNPNSKGTLLILKSVGDCTIAGTINLEGDGANKDVSAQLVFDDNGHEGDAGSNNAAGTGGAGGTGAGLIYSNLYQYSTVTSSRFSRLVMNLAPGSGGGTGGNGNGTTGGNGGRGGGAIIIECAGSLDFSGTIIIDGEDGSPGEDSTGLDGKSGSGAGGGGSAGMAIVLYNSLTANTGTITAAGGTGGAGGDKADGPGGGGGGEGAGAYSGAGGNGGAGANSGAGAGGNGSNAGGAGAGGGGGGGAGSAGSSGGTGGTGGASDSNHYIIAENLWF